MRRFSHSFISFAWRILTVLLMAAPLHGQNNAHWKIYRLDGSYGVGVTLSPRGNVLVKHKDSKVISWLNGYDHGQFAAPEESNFRVYESRTGQLWSVHNQGLMLYFRGTWTQHEIPEIASALATNQLRFLRQIPLLPAEVNHVYILLPEVFLDYDATTRRVGIIKRVSETGLERFTDLQEAPDGGVWISGRSGMMKFSGPSRYPNASSEFAEYLLPDRELYTDLRRVHELPDGGIISVCSAQTSSQRYLVRWQNGKWQFEEFGEERPQQAWAGWDQLIWSFSFNAVFRVNPEDPRRVEKEPSPGSLFDAAVETNGVFWVASSEGVIRYAPFLWRTPRRLEELKIPVHSICFPKRVPEEAWLASSEGLHFLTDEKTASFRWPEDFEGAQPGTKLYELRDGQLLISAGAALLGFDTAEKKFRVVDLDRETLLMGQAKDGSAVLRLRSTNGAVALRKFDGAQLETFLPEALPEVILDATVFLESSSGDLWFGGPQGVVVFRASTSQFESYGPIEGLIPERILCLGETRQGGVWAGGLDRVFELRGKRWEPVLVSVDRIFAIEQGQDDNVWVATANGLFRRVGESWIYQGLPEGLPGLTIYSVDRDARNQIWAATGRGVAIYHPETDPHPPRTDTPQVLRPQQPSTSEPVLIAFSARDKWDYTEPGELMYAYRLDEGAWSTFMPQGVRSFPQLTSGDHRIEVRAMDKNGNIDPNVAMIEFNVILPWFRDPRLIVVIALGLMIILFFAGLAVNRHLQLKRSYARVGQMVEVRTRELEKANQELLHSQKMRAIGTMAAGIAHDFNNILSIIKGSAQVIESNPHDEQKIKTRVDRIQTVVEQGASIVRALLGLGRIGENEVTICDAGELFEETRRLLTDRFSDKVQLQIAAAPQLPKMKCSKDVVQQMLINLVLNAVDAIGGKGTVTLRAARVDTEMQYVLEPAKAAEFVRLSVEDRGTGIAPVNLPRIFEPFFTTKGFSSRRGTGLGLSMVYELAKAIGYGLSVESTPNVGSVFSIIIPVEPKEPPALQADNG